MNKSLCFSCVLILICSIALCFGGCGETFDKALTDENGSVSISGWDFPDGATLKLDIIDNSSERGVEVISILDATDFKYDTKGNFIIYDMAIMNGNEELQPDKMLTISMATPTSTSNYNVFQVYDNGDIEKRKIPVYGAGTIQFPVETLGTFILCESLQYYVRIFAEDCDKGYFNIDKFDVTDDGEGYLKKVFPKSSLLVKAYANEDYQFLGWYDKPKADASAKLIAKNNYMRWDDIEKDITIYARFGAPIIALDIDGTSAGLAYENGVLKDTTELLRGAESYPVIDKVKVYAVDSNNEKRLLNTSEYEVLRGGYEDSSVIGEYTIYFNLVVNTKVGVIHKINVVGKKFDFKVIVEDPVHAKLLIDVWKKVEGASGSIDIDGVFSYDEATGTYSGSVVEGYGVSFDWQPTKTPFNYIYAGYWTTSSTSGIEGKCLCYERTFAFYVEKGITMYLRIEKVVRTLKFGNIQEAGFEEDASGDYGAIKTIHQGDVIVPDINKLSLIAMCGDKKDLEERVLVKGENFQQYKIDFGGYTGSDQTGEFIITFSYHHCETRVDILKLCIKVLPAESV